MAREPIEARTLDEAGPVVRLDRASIDAIARHVVEVLRRESLFGDARSLTAAEVAARFGVSRTWVYEHARELGAIRLGNGKRPRLRFDPTVVSARLNRPTTIEDQTRSEAPEVEESDLIPIRGL